MDEFDCGKQYLCELTAIQATNKNIQDPLVLALQQVKMARNLYIFFRPKQKKHISIFYTAN